MDLSDTAAVVTGGTAGLGLATAGRLVRAGARVVVMGRTESTGKAAEQELGPRAAFVAGDVANDDDVARVVDTAAGLGSLRTVVCCAGGVHFSRLTGHRPMSLADFSAVLQTNLIGTFNVIRHAVPRIAAQPPVADDRGVIVTTSSIAAWDGQAGQSAYAAAKAGTAGMTLPLARELAGEGIRVVNLAPGLFDTPMLHSTVPEPLQKTLCAHIPHPRRLGTADEFAALVEHVIGNSMLNGETIRIDGALRMPLR